MKEDVGFRSISRHSESEVPKSWSCDTVGFEFDPNTEAFLVKSGNDEHPSLKSKACASSWSTSNVEDDASVYRSRETELDPNTSDPLEDDELTPPLYGPYPTQVTYTVRLDPRHTVQARGSGWSTGLFNRKVKFE